MTQDPRGWIARRVIVWALGDHYPFLDPLTINPSAFERVERALRWRLNEPVRPDFHLLAREILQAPDQVARLMAVGKLLAVQINELKIARATAYVLGQTFRDVREQKEGRG